MNAKKTSALEALINAYNNPGVIKDQGDYGDWPVFGCITDHVPIELIYAADILPVRLQGGDIASKASQHLQSFVCSYAKVTTHRAMGGEYGFLDGVLGAKTCNVAVSVFQLWDSERPLKFSWLVSLPGNSDSAAIEYFENELLAIKAKLESFRNTKISENKIADSISLYNAIRETAATLWVKKSEGALNLTAQELIMALKGSQLLPPEISLNLLKRLAGETKVHKNLDKRVRIILLGNDYADAALADTVEQAGGFIAYDGTDNIGSFFNRPTHLEGNPINQLSHYYLSKVSGCYRLTYEDRWAYIQDLISKWEVDACINLTQKYCDTAMFESPVLAESLKKTGIPCLTLEIDDVSMGRSQIKTRVEAFLETIGDI